jgi:hypothetical protein
MCSVLSSTIMEFALPCLLINLGRLKRELPSLLDLENLVLKFNQLPKFRKSWLRSRLRHSLELLQVPFGCHHILQLTLPESKNNVLSVCLDPTVSITESRNLRKMIVSCNISLMSRTKL